MRFSSSVRRSGESSTSTLLLPFPGLLAVPTTTTERGRFRPPCDRAPRPELDCSCWAGGSRTWEEGGAAGCG